MDSGGFNNEGFDNNGDDDDSVAMGEVVVGKLYGPWRTELSLVKHSQFEFTTDSYQGTVPDGTPTVTALEILPPDVPPTLYYYDSEIDNLTLMLSIYYDFLLGAEQRWMPYVGAGVGAARNEVEVSDGVVSGDDDDTDFAWQVGAGIGYQVSNSVDVQIGYRYVDFGKADIDFDENAGNFEADLFAHEVFAGMRWKFGATGP
jgi:opacity protein-like surface antigen